MTYEEFMEIIKDKADSYKVGRHFALIVKPLVIDDVEEAYLKGAETAFRLLQKR